MKTFEQDVKRAEEYHGHLCSGQCIGVKMGRYGMELIGVDPDVNPKDIMVFVECNRCPADAIGVVTGCKVGKRTYYFYDYGKVACSFLNLKTGKAVRIQRKKRMHPEEGEDMVAFYKNLPNDVFFKVEEIQIPIKPTDMPGPPVQVSACETCGEDITDGRQVEKEGRTLCKSCAGQSYYEKI